MDHMKDFSVSNPGSIDSPNDWHALSHSIRAGAAQGQGSNLQTALAFDELNTEVPAHIKKVVYLCSTKIVYFIDKFP